MDDLDIKLFKDLSEEVKIPYRYEYVIKNALYNQKAKSRVSIRSAFLILFRVFITIFITSGVVFASSKIVENIWKEPEKVENFYEDGNELNSKEIDIENYNIISESEAEEKIYEILSDFGYETEEIETIELMDNPVNTEMYYRAKTKNDFLIDLNAKNSKEFKLFTNVLTKNIKNYRGNEDEMKKQVQDICKEHGYDLSQYTNLEISYYNELTSENAYVWEFKYNKKYDDIINRYEEISVAIVPEINELYYFIYTDKAPENEEILVTKEEAIQLATEKEMELDIGYEITDIQVNMDIELMNGYEYIRENDFEQYYEQTHIGAYPVGDMVYYRVEERVRKVWKIKLSFTPGIDCVYDEDSFTYFIDVTTGEIVGGI